MKAPLLFLIAGLAIGAGIILVARPSGDNKAQAAELADASARIAALEAQLKEKARGLEAPALTPPPVEPEKVEPVVVEATEEKEAPAAIDPRAALAKLINTKEGRELAKQAAAAFGSNSERFVGSMVERYKESLGLSDEQATAITTKLAAYAKKRQEKFSEGLDNENKSVEELIQEQGRGREGEQEEVEAILKEELTEEQFAQYEREQLVQQAERVERQSQRELDRLSASLDLTEPQKDEVFGALVRTSPGYDATMQIEGVTETATVEDTPAEVSAAVDQEAARQAAIRAVLTPEQAVKYDEDLANPAPPVGPGRWGGGFGGFGGFGGN